MCSATSQQVLFFLRFVQLGSTVITGFIACFLVWWHDSLNQPTPPALIAVICTSIYGFLECYISSSIALHKRRTNHTVLALTTGLGTILNAASYYALRQVPYVREWCEGNNSAPIYDNVEKRNCAIVCDIIVAGAIAVFFTAMTFVYALTRIYAAKQEGYVQLPEPSNQEPDSPIGGPYTQEKEYDVV